jgi:hypothetical protein
MAIKYLWLGWIAVGMSVALLGTTAEAGPAGVARAGQFSGKTTFVPLSPGAVEPAGWLRDWASAARNGITGHLDEYTPTFHDAWKGPPVTSNAFDADATGGRWSSAVIGSTARFVWATSCTMTRSSRKSAIG